MQHELSNSSAHEEIVRLQHELSRSSADVDSHSPSRADNGADRKSKWQLTELQAMMYSKYYNEYHSCSQLDNTLRLDVNTASMLSQQPAARPRPRFVGLTISMLSELLHSSPLDAAKFGEAYDAINAFFAEYDVFPNTIGLLLGASLGGAKTRSHMVSLLHSLFGPKKALMISMRLEGKTLHEIGVEVGLTRERVRQIVHKVGPESKQTINWLIKRRNASKEGALASDEVAFASAINDRILRLIARHGAVLPSELAQEFSMDERTALALVPKVLRKLVIHESAPADYEPEWSRELILLGIRKAATYYFPLSAGKYQHLVSIGEVKGPSSRVYGKFGTFTELCVEAGVEPALSSRGDYERLWTSWEMLSFVRRYLLEDDTNGTARDYANWSAQQVERTPSRATLQNEFGNWTNVKNRALQEIRILKQKENNDEL